MQVRDFNADRPLRATRDLVVMGRAHRGGEVVDWRALGVDETTARTMHRFCDLAHDAPAAVLDKPKSAPAKKA